MIDFRDQMPCGFDSLGIGPLAPARISSKEINIEHQGYGLKGEVHDFVLYGLDKFEILKVKANAIASKLSVSLRFDEELRAEISNYKLKSYLKKQGLTINLVGDGSVDFILKGLQVDVNIKYSFGIISQKIKIKEFKVLISLDVCKSDITGILGNGFVNNKINEFICEFILIGINDNQNEITNTIEEHVKPIINDYLDQHKFTDLGGSEEPKPKCEPPK